MLSRSVLGAMAALAVAGGVAALPLDGARAAGAAALTEPQAYATAQKAYVYGVAIMEFLRLQRQETSVTVPDRIGDAPFNQLSNEWRLTGAAHQLNVQINNDTLYDYAHLDLARGPIVMHIPRIADHRYFVMQFLDPYTNVFAYVGTRTTGDGGGNWVITGPHWRGRLPAGLRRIRSPYDLTWLSGRTLVNGPADYPAVHRVQAGYRLIPLRDFERRGLHWTAPRPARIKANPTPATLPSGLAFFDQLGAALAQSPPPARDAGILRQLRTVGVGPGLVPSREHLSANVLAGLRAAAADGLTDIHAVRVQQGLSNAKRHHGWFVPPPDTGAYGTDYMLRALIAVNGIGANRPVEAMYPIAVQDHSGALLQGGQRYVLHFARGGFPPARYFWSLTMYNDAFYLIENPINRYSIGNRTPGLHYNRDGSLDIYIQPTRPAGHVSNWLPSPASGRLQMTLRMYGPEPSALDGRYRYPTITEAK